MIAKILATEEIRLGDTISVHSIEGGKCKVFLTRYEAGEEKYKSQPEIFSGSMKQAKKEIEAIALALNAMAHPTREGTAFSVYDIMK